MTFEDDFPSLQELGKDVVKCFSEKRTFCCCDDVGEFCLDKQRVREAILSQKYMDDVEQALHHVEWFLNICELELPEGCTLVPEEDKIIPGTQEYVDEQGQRFRHERGYEEHERNNAFLRSKTFVSRKELEKNG